MNKRRHDRKQPVTLGSIIAELERARREQDYDDDIYFTNGAIFISASECFDPGDFF